MTVYEKNLEALKRKQFKLYRLVTEQTESEKIDITYERARNQEYYPVVVREGISWELNSRYNPGEASHIYSKQYQDKPAFSIFYVFGFGDGRSVQELAKLMDDSMYLVVYEPSMDIFRRAMELFDYSKLFKKANVYISVASEELMQEYMEGIINYNNIRMLTTCILPNYDMVFGKECQHMLESMIFFMKTSEIRRNTIYNFREEFASHALNCMYDYLNATDTHYLKERLAQEDLTDIPAIIVAAGPSLSKNIQELKRAKGKALILVVDAALRATEKAGIRPDLGMSIDARVPDRFFEGVNVSDIPFVFEAISKESLVNAHKGMHIYDEFPCNMFMKVVLKEKDYLLEEIRTGGSISTSAFSLVRMLGFKKIVFIGQDLAFTGGKSHNSALGMDEKQNEDYLKSRMIVKVKANDGTELETDYQMDMYRKWIEKEILTLPEDVTVINATEGGSLIKGAVVSTLREVIDSCTREIDFEKLISEVPPAFDTEEKKHIISSIKRVPKRIEKVREYIREAVKLTDELEQAAARGDVEEQKRLLKEFGKMNKKIQKEPVQDLLLYYNSETEFSVGDDALSAELSIKELCDKAKKWYEGYDRAEQMLSRDLQDKFISRL